METVLLVIHLMVVLALIGAVLLQRSEGGGLGVGGGGNFMSSRGTANALTRTTAILAGIFFLTSIALAVLATQQRAPRSIVTQPAAPSAPGSAIPAPPSSGATPLDQLRSLSQPPQPGAPQPPQPAR